MDITTITVNAQKTKKDITVSFLIVNIVMTLYNNYSTRLYKISLVFNSAR